MHYTTEGNDAHLEVVTNEKTGIPSLPADFYKRTFCLSKLYAKVIVAAVSWYNPNTGKGSIIVRPIDWNIASTPRTALASPSLGLLKSPATPDLTDAKAIKECVLNPPPSVATGEKLRVESFPRDMRQPSLSPTSSASSPGGIQLFETDSIVEFPGIKRDDESNNINLPISELKAAVGHEAMDGRRFPKQIDGTGAQVSPEQRGKATQTSNTSNAPQKRKNLAGENRNLPSMVENCAQVSPDQRSLVDRTPVESSKPKGAITQFMHVRKTSEPSIMKPLGIHQTPANAATSRDSVTVNLEAHQMQDLLGESVQQEKYETLDPKVEETQVSRGDSFCIAMPLQSPPVPRKKSAKKDEVIRKGGILAASISSGVSTFSGKRKQLKLASDRDESLASRKEHSHSGVSLRQDVNEFVAQKLGRISKKRNSQAFYTAEWM